MYGGDLTVTEAIYVEQIRRIDPIFDIQLSFYEDAINEAYRNKNPIFSSLIDEKKSYIETYVETFYNEIKKEIKKL